jgi:hypothetical protein
VLFLSIIVCPSLPPSIKMAHATVFFLEGIEAMNMLRKGRVKKRLAGSDARGQAKFVLSLFCWKDAIRVRVRAVGRAAPHPELIPCY